MRTDEEMKDKLLCNAYDDGYSEAIQEEQERVEKAINKCESHSWEGHKCILVEELKRRLEDEI